MSEVKYEKYKLWVYIEGINESEDVYEDVGEPHSCGEYSTLGAAENARVAIVNSEVPVSKTRLGPQAQALLLHALGTVQSYVPEKLLPLIEEELTGDDGLYIFEFLTWVCQDKHARFFSRFTLEVRLGEFEAAREECRTRGVTR